MSITTYEEPLSQDTVENTLQQEVQPESTFEDYFQALSPIYNYMVNPEIRTSFDDIYAGTPINREDPEFKTMLSNSNAELQAKLYDAHSTEQAEKVFARYKAREEGMKAIEGDPFIVQLAMGAPAALLSPTTMMPMGPFVKALQLKNTVTALSTIGGIALGSGAAAASDELMFAAQGAESHPFSAAIWGAAFGGAVGSGVSIFNSVRGNRVASLLEESSDTYTKDFDTDPDLIIHTEDGEPRVEVSTEGEPIDAIVGEAQGTNAIQRMDKSFLDWGPLKWLNNDVTAVYQHTSGIARSVMKRLAKPTVALKDKAGKWITWGQTATGFKRKRFEPWINKNKDINDAFVIARNEGYKGNKEQFIRDISEHYHDAADKQNAEMWDYVAGEVRKYDETASLETKKQQLLQEEQQALDEAVDFLTMTEEERLAAKKAGKVEFTKQRIKEAEEYANATPEERERILAERVEAKIDKERAKLVEEAQQKFLDEYDVDKLLSDKATIGIAKGAKSFYKFFNNHLEVNKQLGVKGMKGAHKNRLYIPRLINYDNIKLEQSFLDQLVTDTFNSLRKNPLYDNVDDATLQQLAEAYKDRIQSTTYRQSFTHDSYIAPPAEGRTQYRNYHFHTEDMRKYWITNLEELADRYQHQMSGRQALTYAFGEDITHSIPKFMENLEKNMMELEGSVDKDVVNKIANVINDIGGTLRLNPKSGEAAWQATYAATSYQTLRLGATFGVYQGIEAVTSAIMMGVGHIMRSGRLGGAIKDATNLLYKDTEEASNWAKFMIEAGYLGDSLEASRANRFSEGNVLYSTDRHGLLNFVGDKLQQANQKLFKYNGLRYIKSITEDFLGAGVHQMVIDLAKKGSLSDADIRRLAQMGITPEELRPLAQEFEANGLDGVFNMSQQARDKLQTAIINGIEETLVQGESIYLPTWFKIPNMAVTILGQFQRFPLLAHNVYLRKGLTDEQARAAASALTGMVLYGSYRYLREQAEISLGFKNAEEAKYDIFHPVHGEDNLARALIIGTSYSPVFGEFSSLGIAMAKLGGLDFPGNDFNGRMLIQDWGSPTISMAQDMLDVTRAAIDDNHLTDERMYLKAHHLFPQIPILSAGVDDYIKRHN